MSEQINDLFNGVTLPPKLQRLPQCSGLKCKMHPWNKLTKHELIISIRSEYNPLQLFGYLIFNSSVSALPPLPSPVYHLHGGQAEPQLSNSGDVTIQIWEHGRAEHLQSQPRHLCCNIHARCSFSRASMIFIISWRLCWSLQMIAAEAWWMWLMLMGIW